MNPQEPDKADDEPFDDGSTILALAWDDQAQQMLPTAVRVEHEWFRIERWTTGD